MMCCVSGQEGHESHGGHASSANNPVNIVPPTILRPCWLAAGMQCSTAPDKVVENSIGWGNCSLPADSCESACASGFTGFATAVCLSGDWSVYGVCTPESGV
jgi:hypothetical protein